MKKFNTTLFLLAVIGLGAACNDKKTLPLANRTTPNTCPTVGNLGLAKVPKIENDPTAVNVAQSKGVTVSELNYSSAYPTVALVVNYPTGTTATMIRVCANSQGGACIPEGEANWLKMAPGHVDLPDLSALGGGTAIISQRYCNLAEQVTAAGLAAAQDHFVCSDKGCELKKTKPNASAAAANESIYICSKSKSMPATLVAHDKTKPEVEKAGKILNETSQLANAAIPKLAKEVIGAAKTYLAETSALKTADGKPYVLNPAVEADQRFIHFQTIAQNQATMSEDFWHGILLNKFSENVDTMLQGIAASQQPASQGLALADSSACPPPSAPSTGTGSSGTGSSLDGFEDLFGDESGTPAATTPTTPVATTPATPTTPAAPAAPTPTNDEPVTDAGEEAPASKGTVAKNVYMGAMIIGGIFFAGKAIQQGYEFAKSFGAEFGVRNRIQENMKSLQNAPGLTKADIEGRIQTLNNDVKALGAVDANFKAQWDAKFGDIVGFQDSIKTFEISKMGPEGFPIDAAGKRVDAQGFLVSRADPSIRVDEDGVALKDGMDPVRGDFGDLEFNGRSGLLSGAGFESLKGGRGADGISTGRTSPFDARLGKFALYGAVAAILFISSDKFELAQGKHPAQAALDKYLGKLAEIGSRTHKVVVELKKKDGELSKLAPAK